MRYLPSRHFGGARANRSVLYSFMNYLLDSDRRELRQGGALVSVEPQVFDLLHYLIRHRERVVSKDELLAAIWQGRIISDATLSSRINAARAAIGDNGEAQRLIRTVLRKGIRFVGAVREAEWPSAASAAAEPAFAPSERPSIAVLPFVNMSGDPQQEYFVDGITEDIITALSKLRWLLVIARNSTFVYKGRAVPIRQVGAELGARYILEGSVRKSGDQVRATGQLVEAETGNHLWAERYDREIRGIFAVQDEITQRVVMAVDPAVRMSELRRTTRKPPGNLDAWDHFLRGSSSFFLFRKPDMAVAREQFERAIELDPYFATAHARLAMAHVLDAALDWSETPQASLEAAYRAARRAVELDDLDASAYVALAYEVLHMRRYEPALDAARRAVDLNPNFHDAQFALGSSLTYASHPDEAVQVFACALRLSPHDSFAWATHGLAGLAHYIAGRYQDAIAAAEKAMNLRPRYVLARAIDVAARAHLGQVAEAAARLAGISPSSLAKLARLPLRSEADLRHLLDGLHKAGSRDQ